MVAAFATGHTITYTGRIKPTLVLGYTLIFAGLISLSFMSGGLPTYVYAWFVALPMIGQGFSFPTVSIAQLAVTSIEDMAVATSTLMLFRNLGVIMGVSFSSLVAQNSLLYYLMRLVDGPDKMKVISDVRKAVETVKELPPIYQQQVIQAYSLAMRVTFMQGIVTAGLALSLVIFIRLPRLTEKFEQPPPAE
ncbi:putative multidrug resistance protein fnx1 [Phaeomoniella chlamydospora]|uniref:Putative multidrug resistance protein fnx1 n=1 Tax=Phaeomoniella chlamydospora TaxID=158046 RepID=A0A0G2EIC7_PHACM|nr:putative multidrug resistance protein fnx1 [Phaeomoniella chlamydospora]